MTEAGTRITEVPGCEGGRTHGDSDLDTWRDGCCVLGARVVGRLSRRGRRSTHTACTRHEAGAGRADLPRPGTATSTAEPDDDGPTGGVGPIRTA
ncbi:hypothetical protein [Geodermatophilus sp. URMC 60]